jgi:hypothetical protein
MVELRKSRNARMVESRRGQRGNQVHDQCGSHEAEISRLIGILRVDTALPPESVAAIPAFCSASDTSAATSGRVDALVIAVIQSCFCTSLSGISKVLAIRGIWTRRYTTDLSAGTGSSTTTYFAATLTVSD